MLTFDFKFSVLLNVIEEEVFYFMMLSLNCFQRVSEIQLSMFFFFFLGPSFLVSSSFIYFYLIQVPNFRKCIVSTVKRNLSGYLNCVKGRFSVLLKNIEPEILNIPFVFLELIVFVKNFSLCLNLFITTP